MELTGSPGSSAPDRLRFLWRISSRVETKAGAVRTLYRRLRFVARGLAVDADLRRLLGAPAGSSLARLIREVPETAGAVTWPYLCASWSPATRLRRIGDHCAALDRLGPPLAFGPGEQVLLLDAGAIRPGVRFVLDQPAWAMREGLLTLSLFDGDYRAYSLSFSLHGAGDDVEATIGAIQGRRAPDAADRYRVLTKCFHGVRPRDLLVEVLRMLAQAIGVRRISAVADSARVHRSPYFGGHKSTQLLNDYDEIWRDRGGVRASRDFFALPLNSAQRTPDEIAPNKRAMYRKRYEMLATMSAALADGLPRAEPSIAPREVAD